MFFPPFPSGHTRRPIRRLFWGSGRLNVDGRGMPRVIPPCSSFCRPVRILDHQARWQPCGRPASKRQLIPSAWEITCPPRSISDVWPGRPQLDISVYHLHGLPVVRSANGLSELPVGPAESERELRRLSCLFALTSSQRRFQASFARLTYNLVPGVEWLSRVNWICRIVVPRFVGSHPPPHWLRPAAGRHRHGWGLQTSNAADRRSGTGWNSWRTCG